MNIQELLLTSIYVLLIILLIVFIILGIKVIVVVSKTDKLLEDVQNKVSSFDSIFNFIDLAGSKVTTSLIGIVELIVSFLNKIIKRRKEDKEDE